MPNQQGGQHQTSYYNPRQPFDKKEEHIVITPHVPSHNAFSTTKEITTGQSGDTLTCVTKHIHIANCGHAVGAVGPEELQGLCSTCSQSFCFQCGHICQTCSKLFCPEHTHKLENLHYCFKCKTKELFKQGMFTSLRTIHEFFLKEF